MRTAVRSLSVTGFLLAAACYNYVPVDASVRPPDAGESVALEISDQGRVGLAERFGSGVTRIEGRVRSATAADYELEIFKVTYLREGDSRWSGERATVSRSHVARVEGRTFSRGKTAVAIGASVGALAAIVVTRELISSGREPDPRPDPDPGPGTVVFSLFRFFFR
ncbi:MAG: hypothetical protein ACT4OZ_17845 [Gemmatimonadota bacterium]